MSKERGNRVLTVLMAAGSCFYLLPELLRMIIFYLKGSSLTEWVIHLCSAVGILGGMILLVPAMKPAFCEPKQKNKGMIVRFVSGGVVAVFAYLMYDVVLELLYVPLVNLGISHPVGAIVLNVLLALVFIVLQGVTVMRWVAGIMPAADIPTWKQLLKRPIVLLEVVGAVFATNSVPTVISWVLGLFPSWISVNIPIRMMIGLTMAILFACGLWTVIWLVRRNYWKKMPGGVPAEPESAQIKEAGGENRTKEITENEQKTEKRDVRRIPPAAVCGAGIALILIVRAITYYSEDPIDMIADEIQDAAAVSGALLVAGDVEGGLQKLQDAVLIVDLFGGLLEIEGCPSTEELYRRYPSDDMVAYIYFTKNDRAGELAEYLRVEKMNPEFALAWLDMKAEEGISEDEQALAEELKYICASTGTYTSSALKLSDLAGKEEKLELELRKYLELKEQLEFLEIMVQVMRQGTADNKLVDRVLDYAEEYTDSWVAQYAAAVVGSSYTYDGAHHYDRTILAASRFEELYREQNKPGDEELLGIQLKVANMMINCYGYRQAVAYLEKAAEQGGIEEAFSMAAQCYEALGEHKKCYDLCAEMLKEDPDRTAARYYAAVNALKAGKQDDALEHTSKLADLAKRTVTEEDYGADVALYAMLQFIAFNDNGGWTEYQYAFYSKMSEEQKAVVAENTFFADYLEAVYECFGTNFAGHRERAYEAVERVLKENDALPQAWYLKGAILFGQERFAEAAEAYKRSLAIVPDSATTWFALANAYDGMGDYELAYQACERTMALIPVQDHGSDWYGVTVHCERLMNDLKSKIGG